MKSPSKKQLAVKSAIEQGYYVNQDGEFFGKNGKKLILGGFDKDGYPTICIRFANTQAVVGIHRIAAYLKYGDKMFDDSLQVRHLDGDKLNIKWENLELGTVKENQSDRPTLSRRVVSRNRDRVDTITNDEVREIFTLCQEYGQNPLPKEFKDIIFERFDICEETLRKIRKKETRQSAFGQKIISLDCGAHFGFCTSYGDKISKDLLLLDYGFIYFDSENPLGQRQESYTNWLENYFLLNEPDIIVVEEVNRVFSGIRNKKNESSWILQWLYGEVVRLSAKYHLPLIQINPISLKACVTGNGRAKKNEVIECVRKFYPELPKNMRSDTADAIALAITQWRVYNNEYTIGAKRKKK